MVNAPLRRHEAWGEIVDKRYNGGECGRPHWHERHIVSEGRAPRSLKLEEDEFRERLGFLEAADGLWSAAAGHSGACALVADAGLRCDHQLITCRHHTAHLPAAEKG